MIFYMELHTKQSKIQCFTILKFKSSKMFLLVLCVCVCVRGLWTVGAFYGTLSCATATFNYNNNNFIKSFQAKC